MEEYQTVDLIVNDVYEAWKNLDADLLIKHLDPSFIYDSQWVFESLDYDGYVGYIRRKFNILIANGASVGVELIDDPHFSNPSKMLKLNQQGNIAFFRIKVTQNKIVKADLCMF